MTYGTETHERLEAMHNDETYNGWTNRETWVFNLHWQNDQGLYETVKDWAQGFDQEHHDTYIEREVYDHRLGNHIIEQARELWAEYRAEGMEGSILSWQEETGSVWRVDATEVGEAAREALDNG